jgi:hypothetical protein
VTAAATTSAVFGLLLFAQVASAGRDEYPSLVVADKTASARLPTDSIRVTYFGVNGFQFEAGRHVLLVDPYFSRIGFGDAALDPAGN